MFQPNYKKVEQLEEAKAGGERGKRGLRRKDKGEIKRGGGKVEVVEEEKTTVTLAMEDNFSHLNN